MTSEFLGASQTFRLDDFVESGQDLQANYELMELGTRNGVALYCLSTQTTINDLEYSVTGFSAWMRHSASNVTIGNVTRDGVFYETRYAMTVGNPSESVPRFSATYIGAMLP